MKKYHVYGIGNALVDIEIEVTEQELAQLSIEKGVMTLVDKDRHEFLLNELPGTHHKRACGGSAANSVIGAAKLGANCFYSCKIANDETGQFYTDDLHREGVASNLDSHIREDGLTGKCLVMVTPDADRTMNTFLGITGDISYKEVDESSLASSEWLYLEGYLVSTDLARDAAVRAREFAVANSIKTALSFSDPSMVKFFGDGLKNMIGDGVELLFCNREEALLFTGCSTVDEAFEALKSYAKTFAVTLGPDGAIVWDGTEKFSVEAQPVKAVDTNGAGDLFAGAFLYGITHELNYYQAAQLASYAASHLVTEFGPRLSAQGMHKVKEYLSDLRLGE